MEDARATVPEAEEICEDYDRWGDPPPSGVFRMEGGVPVELLGSDGGDPEDQVLSRDWAWVAPALNAAYEAGRKDGTR